MENTEASEENTQEKIGERDSMKLKRLFIILALIGTAAGVAALVILHSFSQKLEHDLEMVDLQGMRGAEAAALLLWRDRLPEEPVEYWYDPAAFTLLPAQEPKPKHGGKGTQRAGGALKDFEAETGKHYDYTETRDYNGQVLHVTVGSEDGTLRVDLDWVPGE